MKALIIIAVIVSALLLLYIIQPKSRRQFILNFLKQIIYLIPRYFA
jgi:hypothetical protein